LNFLNEFRELFDQGVFQATLCNLLVRDNDTNKFLYYRLLLLTSHISAKKLFSILQRFVSIMRSCHTYAHTQIKRAKMFGKRYESNAIQKFHW